MIETTVSFEKALYVIDNAIKPLYLNKIQEIILEQTWQGKTYSEIATDYSYEFEYIKGAGCELWRLLSKAFNEQISKSNFVQFMRRKALATATEKTLSKRDRDLAIAAITSKIPKNKLHPWTTAPDVTKAIGQQAEIECLKGWSADYSCRFILVTGMIGCGKTTLITRYAQQQQDKFDGIVWFSLQSCPEVKVTLKNCLRILSVQLGLDLAIVPEDFDSLLNLLISYLRQYRCLLILDSLESIIEVGASAVYYRSGYENYGQLLRCIITSYHQSLLISASRIKPKLLSFYSREQVRFLALYGLEATNLNKLFQSRIQKSIHQQNYQNLWNYYMHNPQLLNIAVANMERLNNLDPDDFLQYAPLIDEIDYLMNLELSYLSGLEKEIIHWLAIDCYANTIERLSCRLVQFMSKTKLLEGLHNLQERSLIHEVENKYIIAPLIRDYLQRKLVKLSLPSLN